MNRPSPAEAPPRLFHLDVIRGVAMLGILPVNMMFWALPGSAFGWIGGIDAAPASELAAYAATDLLFRAKFISIFSFLFGAGMTLLLESCERSSRSYPETMLRRLGTLWFLGMLHATLLWAGDIVSIYAPMGLAICWFVWLDRRLLVCLGIGAVLLPAMGLALIALVEVAGGAGGMGQSTAGVSTLDPHAPLGEFFRTCLSSEAHHDAAFETAVYRDGSFARITVMRFGAWFNIALVTVFYYGLRLGGLFLLGMGLMNFTAFRDPTTARRPLLVVGLIAAAIAIPLQLVGLRVELREDGGFASAQFPAYLGSAALATSYVAVLCLASVSRLGGVLLRPFAAVGRTAFSNYVFQSVLCNLLFYSYGLRLFGELTRAELWLATGGIWIVEIVVSVAWMRWFRMGPLEWIWRGLTYGELSPLRAGN